jgi:hypothetical protein
MVQRRFCNAWMVNKNIDFLVTERSLQIGFQADACEKVVPNDIRAFNKQVDVTSACQIVGARTKKENTGVRSKAPLDSLTNDVTFLSGKAHAVVYQ